MKGIVDLVKALGPARLAAMGAVGAGLLGFFVFLSLKLSSPDFAVLFADLELQDSMAVVKKLEAMNVPYEVKQDGSIVLAPKEQVLRLRMELAQTGLPAGGGVGYEIFDKGDTLGSTSFVQNVNRLRATEGELSRTIRSLDRVEAARVHLVLPQRQLFAREAPEPSAAIVIKTRRSLEGDQIRAIQHLVASSVEGLKPARVSIVDETGKLLASGRAEEGPTGEDGDERNRSYERRLQGEIEDIVSSVVGTGRARVNVTAELDYNKVTQTSDTFDPDSKVARSTQSREESSSNTTPGGDSAVSVGNELPSANASADSSGKNQDKNTKSEETINYEISRTTKTEVVEAGRIKRLAVAVLVDGLYNKSPDGKMVYAARPQKQLDDITTLVRSAIGFDQSRGDLVHVANLPFAVNETTTASETESGWLDLGKNDYFNLAELVVLTLISLLVLAFVVRPLVRQIVAPDKPLLQGLTVARPGSSAGGEPFARLAAPGFAGAPAGGAAHSAAGAGPAALGLPAPSRAAELIKLAKVSGEVRAASVREVGEMVQSNPDDAVTIVRNWLEQGA